MAELLAGFVARYAGRTVTGQDLTNHLAGYLEEGPP